MNLFNPIQDIIVCVSVDALAKTWLLSDRALKQLVLALACCMSAI